MRSSTRLVLEGVLCVARQPVGWWGVVSLYIRMGGEVRDGWLVGCSLLEWCVTAELVSLLIIA